MSIKNTYQQFCNQLSAIYDEGEAQSIGRIIFEDTFKIYDFSSEAIFSKEKKEVLERIERRLMNYEPMQYVLGEADFYGFKFKVDKRVLIPRQETEELVFWIKNTINQSSFSKNEIKLLDIGTGSGCIPITLKKIFPEAGIHALDVSEEALNLAKENATILEAPVIFYQKNILEKNTWADLAEYEIIVSNPPYIPHSEAKLMPVNVKRFEPHLALFVDNHDPLIFYRIIADFALEKLTKGGFLFFETNEHNAQEVASMLQNKSFTEVILEKDLNGKERMVRAKL